MGLISSGKKGCSRCGKIHALDRFQRQNTKLGYRSSCKYCRHVNDRKKNARVFFSEDRFWFNHRTSLSRIVDKTNRTRDLERDRTRYIRNQYNVDFPTSVELYNLSTKGTCEICDKCPEKNKKALSVDHCHKTGVVRGILCQDCNMGIGNLKDNTKILKKAIKYLKKTVNWSEGH